MKVGIVCPYNMFSFAGGVQEIVRLEAEGLSELGHQVKIITPRPFGYYGTTPANYILLGRSAKINTPQKTMVDISIKIGTEEIRQMLADEQFDVLHFHEPAVPMLSRQILSLASCPSVGTLHAAIPDSKFGKSIIGSIKPYVRKIFGYLDVITAVSEPAKEYFVDLLTDVEVRIIPNALNLQSFVSKQSSSDLGDLAQYFSDSYPTISYVGRLEKRKSIDLLIPAFAELLKSEPDSRLLIAGKGSSENMLRSLVAKMHLNQSVTFLGYIDDKAKITILKNSDLFVSPARSGESFGIVLIEAMASGTPMLVGDNPGYKAVMNIKSDVCVIDPTDPVAYSNRMIELLNNVSLRDELITWGKKEVKKYESKKIIKLYEQLLLKIAAQ
jgi:phosphatidyl-myo-inositol alpha-mannosyltransferase